MMAKFAAMTLADYLDHHKLTYAAFAAQIDVRHPRTVERYAKGQRIPDRNVMPRIVAATEGQVTPNDFHVVDASLFVAAPP